MADAQKKTLKYEDTNRIEIHSTDIPANGDATQGVENSDGTEGIATPGRNAQSWSASEDYVAFFYEPGGPADNCGLSTSIDLSQTLFTCSDLGDNTITITLTDTDGNAATCTSIVTIIDPLVVCALGNQENELVLQIACIGFICLRRERIDYESHKIYRSYSRFQIGGRG